MAVTAAELTWLNNTLTDLCIWQDSTHTLLRHMSALQLTINPVFHARTKHVAIDYH